MVLWKNLHPKWQKAFFVLIVAEIILFIFFDYAIRSSTIKKIMDRQQVYIQVQTDITESFFKMFGSSFTSFSKLSTLLNDDQAMVADMDEFVKRWKKSGFIGGLILTDMDGVVLYNSTGADTRDVGISVADRDYFIWAKSQTQEGVLFVGEPVISKVGASKDKAAIPIASPVLKDGKFKGVLVGSVILEPIMTHYIDLLRFTDQTEIYLANYKGVILYSTNNDFSLLGSGLEDLLGENINIDLEKSGKIKSSKYIVNYSPLVLENQNWLLVLFTPVSSAYDVGINPVHIRQFAFLFLVGFTFLLFALINSRSSY